ncbi:MAG: sortase [Saccharofermentanales bacterium]|jgi:LPXTG-site transpeptidase (sortase) family protein
MDENNKLPEEKEIFPGRMRAPKIRKSEDEKEPANHDTEAQTDTKATAAKLRRPSFNLSVPSGVEEEEEAETSDAGDESPYAAEEAVEIIEAVYSGGEDQPPGDPPDNGEDSPEDDEDKEEDHEGAASHGRFKTIWRSRTFSRILLGLSILFFVVGIYFFVKPALIHRNQEKAGKELLDLLEKQKPEETGEVSIEVNIDDVYMPGSFDDSFDVILPPGVTGNVTVTTSQTEAPPAQRPRTIIIKSDTIMKIPSINYESAIAPDVEEATLWVLPGHFPASAQPGEPGVAAYFGHRMIKRGLHFNRLNEVKVGDKVQIKRFGETFNYIVDYYKIVEPSELGPYVYEKTDTSRILLVTCDPIIAPRSTKKRILVGGYLEGGLPAP